MFRRPIDLAERAPLAFVCDGRPLTGRVGDTVATALLVAGMAHRRDAGTGAPRGPYCLMGACQECRVTIDGVSDRRACRETLAEGMVIETRSPLDRREIP